jgi:hypothetical protein
MVCLNELGSRYQVQHSLFDHTLPVDMNRLDKLETVDEDEHDRLNPSGFY